MSDPTRLEEAEPNTPERASAMSGRVMAIVMVIAVIAVAVVGRAWLDIGSSRPLPGTPLTIQTDAPLASGGDCPATSIPPTRLAVRGSSLVLLLASDGSEIPVVWPAGYAARLDQGHGGLYDGAGYLVAVAGEVIQDRFFGAEAADGAFHICRVASD